jgi:anti-sigma factor ChrR (cupin superfamily)
LDATNCATTANSAHADGRALLAVAEGDADHPPSDAVVAHIFSCERCSGHVRELRAGLAGLASTKSAASSSGHAKSAKSPSSAVDAIALDDDAAGEPELTLLEDEEETIDRARLLVWKVAIVGGVLAAALYVVRFLAPTMR